MQVDYEMQVTDLQDELRDLWVTHAGLTAGKERVMQEKHEWMQGCNEAMSNLKANKLALDAYKQDIRAHEEVGTVLDNRVSDTQRGCGRVSDKKVRGVCVSLNP